VNAVVKDVPAIDDIDASLRAFIAEHNLENVNPEPTHYHTPELYGRRIVVPTGVVFTTKVHKSDHIAVCLRGHIVIMKEDGSRFEVKAPDVFITPKGTQRFIYVVDEVEWLTVHACKEQDMDRVEKALVCNTMEEYNRMLEAPK
jgi:quercetin dioxygenase-like cupin family protein